MSNDGARIAELRRQKGLADYELGWIIRPKSPSQDAARMFQRRIEAGEAQLTVEDAREYAKAFEVPLSSIIEGVTGGVRRVPLVGFIGVGDLYYPDPRVGAWAGFDFVESPPGDSDGAQAVIVQSDDMAPVFRDRDVLFFKKGGYHPSECVGEDCIVKLRNSPLAYLKTLRKGSRPDRYDLHSYSKEPPLRDQDVEWAAPVEAWRRPRRRGASDNEKEKK